MDQTIRVLIVDDSEDDAQSITEAVEKDGYQLYQKRVDTPEALQDALNRQEWDIVIADYDMPVPGGHAVPGIVQRIQPGLPVIVVAHDCGGDAELLVVERKEADACVPYGLPDALGPAVDTALHESKKRRYERPWLDLREGDEACWSLLGHSTDGVLLIQDGIIRYANTRIAEMFGYSVVELVGNPFIRYLPPSERDLLKERYLARMTGADVPSIYEVTIRTRDGNAIDLEIGAGLITYRGKLADLVFIRDIRERKIAQKQAEVEKARVVALETVASAALSTLDIQDLLDTLTVKMAEILSVPYCSVSTFNEYSHDFTVRSTYGMPETVGYQLSAREGLAEIVCNKRSPVYVADLERAPVYFDPHLKERKVRSVLAVPLIARDKLLGMARAFTTEIRSFTLEEVRLFEAMASRAALAIDNANLYASSQRSREEIEATLASERRLSVLLQRALLPATPMLGKGYRASFAYVVAHEGQEIGGDFYDAFPVAEGTAGIIIGDVSGKGLEAAALGATTRATMHAFAHETGSTAQVTNRSNSVLCAPNVRTDSFVTAFIAILDLATGHILYTNSGHVPPIIYRTGGSVEFLLTGQLPLCVLEGRAATEVETYLDPGDKLILYTDGILEAKRDSIVLSEKRITRLIKKHGKKSPEEIVRILLEAAVEWANGRLTDDAAILVVERMDKDDAPDSTASIS